MLVLSHSFFCHDVFKKLSAAEAPESVFWDRVNSFLNADAIRLISIDEDISPFSRIFS